MNLVLSIQNSGSQILGDDHSNLVLGVRMVASRFGF